VAELSGVVCTQHLWCVMHTQRFSCVIPFAPFHEVSVSTTAARRSGAPRPASRPAPGAADAGLSPEAAAMIRRARFASVRAVFRSDAEVATLLDADRSRAARWKAGAAMDAARWEFLQALDTVVGLLRGWLAPTTIPKWLHGVNAHLGHRRPLDVLRDGRLSEVIAAIEAEKSGAFA